MRACSRQNNGDGTFDEATNGFVSVGRRVADVNANEGSVALFLGHGDRVLSGN